MSPFWIISRRAVYLRARIKSSGREFQRFKREFVTGSVEIEEERGETQTRHAGDFRKVRSPDLDTHSFTGHFTYECHVSVGYERQELERLHSLAFFYVWLSRCPPPGYVF